jgi:4-oxalocrotonate tautomerase
MPVISVEWLEGRTAAQKAALARAITQAFIDEAQVKPEQVWIVFRDVKRSDWAMSGALLDKPSGSSLGATPGR